MHVTYRERAPGTWRLRIENGRDAEGKRRFSYETLKGNEEVAQRRRFELLNAHEQGTFSDPKKLRFGAFLDQWIKNRAALGHICRGTAETYGRITQLYVKPALGGTRVQRVTGAEIQGLYTALVGQGLSRGTVKLVHALMCGVMRSARKSKIIAANPMEEVDAPQREKAKPKAIDNASVAKLLNALRGDWKEPIVLLSLTAGLRRGEVLGLRWGDIDLDAARLRVRGQLVQYEDHSMEWKAPKSEDGTRGVSLAVETVDMLRAHRKQVAELRMKLGLGGGMDDAYVFTSNGVLPISPDRLTKSFGQLCDRIGMPKFTFHGTRHTHITSLLKRVGVAGAKAVSQRAGHANVAFTLDVYQTVFDEDERELGNISGIMGAAK